MRTSFRFGVDVYLEVYRNLFTLLLTRALLGLWIFHRPLGGGGV